MTAQREAVLVARQQYEAAVTSAAVRTGRTPTLCYNDPSVFAARKGLYAAMEAVVTRRTR